MAYIPITDDELLPGKPVTPSLFRRLRDNIDQGLTMLGVNMEVLAGAGNWSPPVGIKVIKVTMCGGGGGGGGAQSSGVVNYGGGGAGAQTKCYIIDIDPPYDGTMVFAYSIGAGGIGASDTTGTDGTGTTFNNGATTRTTGYGRGGTRRTGVSGLPANAAPDGEEYQLQGDAGISPYSYTSNGTGYFSRAYGGKSLFSPRGANTPTTVSAAGQAAQPFGGGGGGALSTGGSAVAGGNGAAGTIIIEY